MLYLEDFLEKIESLPAEIRDKFTDMRELDLQVHNNMDDVNEQMKNFFRSCAENPAAARSEEKGAEFARIIEEYNRILEVSDEKLKVANQMCSWIDSFLQNLDEELLKFKYDLEADHTGITEILEKQSLELDKPINYLNGLASRNERRRHALRIVSGTPNNWYPSSRSTGQHQTLASLNTENSSSSFLTGLHESPSLTSLNLRQQTKRIDYDRLSKGLIDPPNSSLDLGSSNGSSFGNLSLLNNSSCASRVGSSSTFNANNRYQQQIIPSNPQPSVAHNTGSGFKRIRNTPSIFQDPATPNNIQFSDSPSITPTPDIVVNVGEEWEVDQNEPKYCLCNDVSYGEMVACDNTECAYGEWFHYGCVNLSTAPKGKWFCPSCTSAQKRRSHGSRR